MPPAADNSANARSSAALDANWLVVKSKELGFDLCGVAPAAQLVDNNQLAASERSSAPMAMPAPMTLNEWLARGFAGEMGYLHDPRRADPALVVPEARSVIVCALNYDQPLPYSIHAAASGDQARGWISRYAWGEEYHTVVGDKLDLLLAALRKQYGESFAARAYVDTGPISERAAAKVAGLGWVGKNTCIINKDVGSWLFLGVIITSLTLHGDAAGNAGPGEGPNKNAGPTGPGKGPHKNAGPWENVVADLCGNCTLCLDACPTGALVEPYVMDARRCISYLTIELRGSIPEEFRADMGWQVFGCDICQDVCPWNRASTISTKKTALAPISTENISTQKSVQTSSRNVLQNGVESSGTLHEEGNAFAPRAGLFAPELDWLLSLTQEEFSKRFRGSPVKRTKWRGLIRNACIAAGNALRVARKGAWENDKNSALEDSLLRARLAELAASDDAIIAEHARWALDQAAGASMAARAPVVPHA